MAAGFLYLFFYISLLYFDFFRDRKARNDVADFAEGPQMNKGDTKKRKDH